MNRREFLIACGATPVMLASPFSVLASPAPKTTAELVVFMESMMQEVIYPYMPQTNGLGSFGIAHTSKPLSADIHKELYTHICRMYFGDESVCSKKAWDDFLTFSRGKNSLYWRFPPEFLDGDEGVMRIRYTVGSLS